MKESRRMYDISSTEHAWVQYESCTDAKAILSWMKEEVQSVTRHRERNMGVNAPCTEAPSSSCVSRRASE